MPPETANVADVPSVTLNDLRSIPQLGYGVFQIPPTEAQAAVEHALEAGYRMIDTAAAYNNESGVGAAIRASGIQRSQLFLTTKLRNGDQGYDRARVAYDDSLRRLGVDYVDLYLIHWPSPARGLYLESWKALESLHSEGRARSIGVSNFLPEHLERLLAVAEIVPAINQIELHPTFQQSGLVHRLAEWGITVEAYSPLGQAVDLEAEVAGSIAMAHNTSAAAVILRWHLQRGHVVIPKSAHPERMRANLECLTFDLNAAEMEAITALDAGNRVGGDPQLFEISQIR
jgi:diketogulonate reductase-like aldo/keto reductase